MADLVDFSQTTVICSTCQGDPRRSVKCPHCGGAGVGLPSDQGFLVWSARVDDFSIALRKMRRSVRAVLRLACLIYIGLAAISVGWHITQLTDIASLFEFQFWISGHWSLNLMWSAALVACFLVFHWKEFSAEAKPLPEWGKTHAQLEELKKKQAINADYRFEISPYFSPEAMTVVEGAYEIAKSLGRSEITPTTLIASALASPSGGVFLIRSGLSFDQVKGPMARLLSAEHAGTPPIVLSREAKRVLALTFLDASAVERQFITPIELFIVAFIESEQVQNLFDQLGHPPEEVKHVAEWIRLQERMREDHKRFVMLAAMKPSSGMNRAMTARQTPLLDRFSEDLTLAARNGYLAPIVGREKEMEEMLRAIESGRRGIALIGEQGVGKAAIIEQLARRMVEEDVPPELFDRRLVSVDIARVIAAGDPSLAADRLVSMLHEAAMSGNIVLAMQGAEALSGSGASGQLDLSEIMSSELDKRGMTVILSVTPRAWTQHLERRSIGAKLASVQIRELEPEQTLTVLMAKSGYIEYEQRVFLSFAAIDRATQLTAKYMHDIAAPENALSVIREAAVLCRKAQGERTIVSGDDVASVVTDKTRIPVESLTRTEADKLLSLESHLHARVIGQSEAVQAVSQALRRARAELREGKRPIANFLFLGPTGVGKTELSKALAAEYFGNEQAMIRLDMSEYQDKTSLARLIGFPGDERGGLLTEAVRKQPFALVLLDELEKAHADILNVFLQVMDDGRLTDGVGRTIDFTNVMLIATSNAGTSFIQDEVAKQTPLDQIKTGLLERELKGLFRPEFLNRFDGVIVFTPLTMDEVTQIAWLLINGISKRLLERGIEFTAQDEAVEELAHAGYDPLFGARPLRRVIQERVDNALADLFLRGEVGRKDQIILQKGGQLQVIKAKQI
ncbi:ATP-dependent Clp protease ATP-binding subunit [Patescibacteria group bacterium]|nr:ATP-dependent Clp protease ATP-binding subunit [Patescibacteria group bacterium]